MKVKCIKNSYIHRNNLEYQYDNEIFGNLIIGNTYTVVKKYDDSFRGGTYVIKEIARFVPAILFIKVEDMREDKLKQLGI
jgi:hypothetical protein